MKFFNRTIPWVVSLAVFIIVERIFVLPKQIYFLVPIILGLVFLAVWQLAGRKFKETRFWLLVLTPLCFALGGSLFLSFLQGRFIKHFFALFLALALGIFLEVIYSKFHNRIKYQPHSLENISFNLNIITVFFIASGFFSLITFLGFSFLFFWLLFIVIILLLNYQIIWLAGSRFSIGGWYLFIITLIMAEVFWAVNFLPTSIYVNGLLLTISYYLLAGLSRNWLLDIKEFKVVKRYLFTSLIILVIILITAKWF